MSLINTKEAFAQLNKLNPRQAVINKEYQPNYFESIYLKGQQIGKTRGETDAGLFSIYQVPVGYTLFITSVNMAVNTLSIPVGTGPYINFSINNSVSALGGAFYITLPAGSKVAGAGSSLSINPTLPIFASSGQYLLLNIGAGNGELMGQISFCGILVNNSLL